MFKSKGLERHDNAAMIALQQGLVADRQPPTPVSCIGAGMSIIGNVECRGPAQVFGRIEGELHATELVIGEGAQIEGSIQAQEVTISGRVKGTIRAIRVKLQGATVEGEIIHRTLSMDESSVFEGSSRRVENPVERRGDAAESSSHGAGKATAKKVAPGPSLVPSAAPAGNGALQPN
jgi:cytoskeletal protein CcmA (bactofilin family)